MKLKKKKEERMASFVNRGNLLVTAGKTHEAIQLVSEGLQYYSEKVLNALNPYSTADAGLIVAVLRHIADEMEENNPGAKELAAYISSNKVTKPPLKETKKQMKPNKE